MNLDEISIFELIDLMHKEDLNVIAAVKKELHAIKKRRRTKSQTNNPKYNWYIIFETMY